MKWDELKGKKASERPFAFGARSDPALLRALNLPRPGKNQEPLQVISQILQSDLSSGSREANRTNQVPAHCGDLITEHMFDPSANTRTLSIASLLLSPEKFVAIPFLVKVGAQTFGFELRFDVF